MEAFFKKIGSRKFFITVIVVVLCAMWMFGGDGVQAQMAAAPDKLKGFAMWLGVVVPIVMGLVAGSYNLGQGKVDAAAKAADAAIKIADIKQ